MTSLLILISGLPCTGKTTLAKQIAKELSLPLISRDDIKESLFDSLGWQNREWSKKLGIASYDLLYYFIESLVYTGISLIIESNFKPDFDEKKFCKLQIKYELKIIQIHCQSEKDILFQRFQKRSESGERHPGHVDHLNYEEFKTTCSQAGHEVLNIESTVIEIDTTNFEKIDYKSLFERIKSS